MKTNRLKYITAAVMLLGAAASGTALAQRSRDVGNFNAAYNSSWYILPSADWIDPDNRFGTDDHGEGGGIRLGKVVSPTWDIQFGPTFSKVNDGNGRYKQDTFGVDALYMFSRERFRPFLLIGGGAQRDRVEGPFGSSDRQTSPFLNAGIGFQYSFSEQVGMQLDYRRMYAKLDRDDFGFDRANTNVVTLGLTYAFGKRAAPVRVSTPPPAPMPPIAAAPPAPPPRPAAPPPPPPPRFERFTLSATDLFDFDRAALRTPQPKLDEIAAALNANAQVGNVTISGYTDHLGSTQYNMGLSQRRAEAVKAYLVSKGVSPGRLTAIGKGETNPVVQCTNKNRADLIACLQPNRRVEVEQIVVERRVQ